MNIAKKMDFLNDITQDVFKTKGHVNLSIFVTRLPEVQEQKEFAKNSCKSVSLK